MKFNMKFDSINYTSEDIEELEMRALRNEAMIIVAKRLLEEIDQFVIPLDEKPYSLLPDVRNLYRSLLADDVASFPDEVKSKAISLSGLCGIISVEDF